MSIGKRILIGLVIIVLLLTLMLMHWRGRTLLFSTVFNMPMATNKITVRRDIGVVMSDGTVLSTNVYFPQGVKSPSAILMRTPYDQNSPSTAFFAKAFAHRGFIVVTQDARGTGQSEGEFIPLSNERRDGSDTLNWLSEQEWFNGHLGLFGLSYLGFTANAIAVQNHPAVKAVFAANTTRSFFPVFYDTGGFNLDLALSWAVIVQQQQSTGRTGPNLLERILSRGKQQHIPFDTLPIKEADIAVTGTVIDFYRTFVTQTQWEDEYWQTASLTESDIAGIDAPVYLASSWYDAVLPRVLEDYNTLTQSGKRPRLVIGDGPHVDTSSILRHLRHAISWFNHHLKGEPLTLPTAPVQILRMGDKQWQALAQWPVTTPGQTFYLSTNNTLTPVPNNAPSARSDYLYDPANPTPAIGGPLLSTTKPVVNNSVLEARNDTLTFTTDVLNQDTDILGTAKITLFVSSDRPTSDIFVRLNRVDKNNQSTNITDGITRLQFDANAQAPKQVELSLWPTAIRLKAGEKLRLVIASGAHPRIARNTGEGDLFSQAVSTSLLPANVTIHHNQHYLSRISLPFQLRERSESTPGN